MSRQIAIIFALMTMIFGAVASFLFTTWRHEDRPTAVVVEPSGDEVRWERCMATSHCDYLKAEQLKRIADIMAREVGEPSDCPDTCGDGSAPFYDDFPGSEEPDWARKERLRAPASSR